jgi:hypothetical protein
LERTVASTEPVPLTPVAANAGVPNAREGDASADTERIEGLPLEPGPPAPSGRRGRWRPFVAGLLIAVAALLAPLSVLAIWAHDELSNTDRYVSTVAPLANDPVIQEAIVQRASSEIFDRLQIPALAKQVTDALAAQGVPTRITDNLAALSGPLTESLRNFVTDKIRQFVQSPEFAAAWEAANREAHVGLVAVLSGEGSDSVSVQDNKVTIKLATIIKAAQARLVANGFELAAKIPTVNAQFTIIESDQLGKSQAAYRALESVARWLPVLALLLLGAAVWVSRSRRRALLASGLAVAGSMLLLGLLLNVLRPIYLDSLPSTVRSHEAAGVVYDTLVEFIRLNLRAVLVVALAVTAGAWIAGPSGAPLSVRRGMAGAASWTRGNVGRTGMTTGPVGDFLYSYRTPIRALVIGGGAVTYLMADHPTGALSVKVLVVVAGLLLVHELLARPPVVASGEADTPPPAAA